MAFITDNGQAMKFGDQVIERYGVWRYDAIKRKPQCVEVSAHLNLLIGKYYVRQCDIHVIKKKD